MNRSAGNIGKARRFINDGEARCGFSAGVSPSDGSVWLKDRLDRDSSTSLLTFKQEPASARVAKPPWKAILSLAQDPSMYPAALNPNPIPQRITTDQWPKYGRMVAENGSGPQALAGIGYASVQANRSMS